MNKLPNEYKAHGRIFHLVKRDDKKAMFKSDDNIIEVFRIKVLHEAEIYGRVYPEREVAPNDEDFGNIAWCYSSNEELAQKKYDSL